MQPDRIGDVLSFIRERVLERGGSYIYLVECEGFVKIGIAGNVRARLRELQVGNPFRLHLLGSFQSADPLKEEGAIHKLLDAYRERGEWFRLPPAMVNHVLAGKHWSRMRNADKDPEYHI